MSKYFGTDGFRGEANVRLTAELAYRTGRFVGSYYASRLKAHFPDKEAAQGRAPAQDKEAAAQDKVAAQGRAAMQDKVATRDRAAMQDKVTMQDKVAMQDRVATQDSGISCADTDEAREGRIDSSEAGGTGRCAMRKGGDCSMPRPRIVIGEDTRHSCIMLRNALAAGITASGGDVYVLGVTTTPSVSYAARTGGFDCGIMISASHNPYYDNGIKIISGDGTKLNDDEIGLIEKYLEDGSEELPYALRENIGRTYGYSAGREHYKNMLIDIALRESLDLRGKRIALDCANGSAGALAPGIFRELGADTVVIGDGPDGFNINAGVGSTHMERLRGIVRDGSFYMGFAYDGDADRCLACDENGNELNGDMLIYANALDMKSRGALNGNAVALTVMSNLGAFKAFEKAGISCEQTAVGDRYVWERMREKHISLGGEQSGHIIFASDATTGDGILTSLKTLAALRRLGKKPSDIAAECAMYPQCLKNVKVRDKDWAAAHPDVIDAVKQMEERLGGNGRILLRKSGTEPVVRVMAEAGSMELCEEICGRIASAIQNAGV